MNKRILAIACLAAAAAVVGWWATTERSMFTKNQVQHTVKVKDDFGDEVEKITWEDKFVPGLLDVALPADGALTVAAAVLLFLDAKARKKQA